MGLEPRRSSSGFIQFVIILRLHHIYFFKGSTIREARYGFTKQTGEASNNKSIFEKICELQCLEPHKIITIFEYIIKRKNVFYLDFIFVIILSSFFYFIFV